MKAHYAGVLPEGLDTSEFDDPFSSAGWLDYCRRSARKMGIARARYLGNPDRSIMGTALGRLCHYMTSPMVAARHFMTGAACARHLLPVAYMMRDVWLREGRVRVLDIGGGYGDNFFELAHALPAPLLGNLHYDVADNSQSLELGRSLYSRYKVRPSFIESITDTYDIVLVVGTLQYIPKWRDFLEAMRARSNRYLYVARSPIANQVDSFTTVQTVCPENTSLGKTRINVIGLHDLRHAMQGWRACFEFADTDYSAQFAELPQPWRDASYYCMGWQH